MFAFCVIPFPSVELYGVGTKNMQTEDKILFIALVCLLLFFFSNHSSLSPYFNVYESVNQQTINSDFKKIYVVFTNFLLLFL